MSAAAVVDRWARETEDRLRAVLRSAAQDVAEAVSVGLGGVSPGTPVDTGFAQSSWVAQLGDVPVTPVQPPKGLTSGQLRADGQEAAAAMGLVIASADIRDVITIGNGAEYLAYLEDGSTPITSAGHRSGWIAETVTQWSAIVSRAVQRVRSAGRV